MKGSRIIGLLAAGACAVGVAFAQRGGSSEPPPPDEKPSMEAAARAGEELPGTAGTMTSASPDHAFAMKAARGGMAEVEFGRIAAQKGGDESVKQFGQKMVDDHSKANDELKQIASTKGIPLPSAPDAKDQKMADRLQKMSGAEFDKAYMKDMVSDHRKDVAEFEREARSGKDPELKAFAEKTLPTLRQHLQMAEDAAVKVGAGAAAPKKTGAGSP